MSSSEEEIGDPVDVSDEEVEVDNEEEEDEVVSDMSEAGEHDEDSDEVMDEEQEEDSSFIERDEDEQEVDVSSSPQVEEDRSEVEAGSSDQPEIPSEDVEVEHVETDPAEVELEPEHVEHGEDQGPSASTTLADAPTVEVSPVELSIIEKWKEVRHELDESRPRVFGDSQRENLEDRCRELEETVTSLQEELASKRVTDEDRVAAVSEDGDELTQIRIQLENSKKDLEKMAASNERLLSEKEELRNELSQVSSSFSEMSEIATNRQNEIDNIKREQMALQDELMVARTSKNETLVQSEELESRELSLQYREKRLSDERELMEQRVSSLAEELHQTHEELLSVRRENVAKISHIQRELNDRNDEYRQMENKVIGLQDDKARLQERLEDVLDRLKSARNSTHVEETYRQEIRANAKLAEVYKAQVSDSEEKCQELQKAVETLQSLLKEASERFGVLEENYEREKADNKEEIRRRNDAIRALKKELDDANELIKTFKQKDLIKEGIAHLSPAAAIASKLVKSGMSLTQVYTQLVACEEELIATREEKDRLNTYVEQILQDIEVRAPAMKRQREEYEHAVETVKTLEGFLEEERELNSTYKQEAEINRQRLATAGRENERLRRQVTDLGQQVSVLLREVESARFGGRPMLDESETSLNSSTGDADSVISKRLVTFRDVRELQQRNAELLAVVREMSANQERAESQLVEEKTNELKHELDIVTGQVEELREARRRQETMVETLVQQRDMYKAIADSNGDVSMTPSGPKVTSTPGNIGSTPSPRVKSVQAYHELETRAAKAETAFKDLKADYESFKTEKTEQVKILEEKLEKTREDLNESRAKVIKLASQEEYNTERFKISQANATSFKKEISQLESKKSSLQSELAKREHSIQILQNQLTEMQSKLSRNDSQLSRALQEVHHYKASEARLVSEISVLQRQTSGSSAVAENLKKFQVQLEKADNEEKRKLQVSNETLSKEISLLRKKLDGEQESYRASVKAWESSQNQMRTKLEDFRAREQEAQNRLHEVSTQVEELRSQLRANQEKWGDSSIGANISSEGGAVPNLSDLQSQVRALKNDTVNLKELLSNAREAAAKFQQLAEASEARVIENTEAAQVMQDHFKQQLSDANQAKTELEGRVQHLVLERDNLIEQVRSLEAREDPVEQVQRQLDQTRSELERVIHELQTAQRVMTQMEAELTQQVNLLREMEERYEREVVLHGETTKALVDLREAAQTFDEQVVQLQSAKRLAEEGLKDLEARCFEIENTSRTEMELLKNQYDVIEKENAALHEQLSNMSHMLTTLNKSGADLDVSLAGNESSDQLMDIVKFLRREKEILTTKMEVMQTESARIKSQLDFAQKELAESRSALALAVEKANAEILPSSKYAQLLENVEAIPALNESNRVLRQNKEKLEKELQQAKANLEEALKSCEPLKQQLREYEEREDKHLAELEALKGDNNRWRQRANQLIEKNQKINPEEMKRIENENSKLTNQIKLYQTKLSQNQAQINNLTNKVKEVDEKLTSVTKTKDAEIQRLVNEATVTKNHLMQIGARLNLSNKKIAEHESTIKTLQAERDNAKAELERVKTDVQTGAKTQAEFEAQTKSLNDEIQSLKKSVEENETVINASKNQISRLKQVGRTYKEKFEMKEVEVTEKDAAITKLEAELKNARETSGQPQVATPTSSGTSSASEAAGSANDEKLAEAEALVELSETRILELEDKIKEILKENQKLQDSSGKATEKEKRAKGVLVTAKEKITNLTQENEALNREIAELRTLREAAQASAAPQACDHEAQINTLRAEKDLLVEELTAEKERLLLQIEQLQNEIKNIVQAQQQAQHAEKGEKSSIEAVTASVKPVMAASQPAAQRKTSIQPQAHIQPTRHAPAQTPTNVVRPTAMRTSSTMRTSTSQSDIQLPQMSVQPIISTFVPATVTQTTTVTQEQQRDPALLSDEVPRALVQPRQSSEEPIPGPSFVTSVASPPAAAQTVPLSIVPVAPTQKRTRDSTEASDSTETENKKARVATTEAQPQSAPAESAAPLAATAMRVEEDDEVVLVSSDDEEIEEDEAGGDDEMSQDVQEEEEGEEEEEDAYESDEEQMGEEGEQGDEEEGEMYESEDQDQQVQQDDDIVLVDSDDDDDHALHIDESQSSRNGSAAVVPEMSSSAHETLLHREAGAHESAVDQGAATSVQPSPSSALRHTQDSVGDSVVPSGSSDAKSSESNLSAVDDVTQNLHSDAGDASTTLISQEGYEGTSVDIASFSAEAGGDSYSNVASPEGQGGGADLTGDQGEGEDFSQDVGEAIQVLTSSGGQRGRAPRLTRTPIVWDDPAGGFGGPTAENPAAQRGRGGTARRARGSHFSGRGTRPMPKSRGAPN